MELLSLMDMLEEVIENSPKVPLSSKVMVDKDEIFELIKDIRLKMPDEIKKAEWVRFLLAEWALCRRWATMWRKICRHCGQTVAVLLLCVI